MSAIVWTNEKRRLGDLIPWGRNPRQIKRAQAVRLEESLVEFGQVQTFAVGPDNSIYDGHQRDAVWSMSDKFGPDYEVDVRVSSRPLSEKEREKLTVYLHKGAAGEWNFDALANEFEVDDLLEWGFEEWELGIDGTEDAGKDTEAQTDRAEELRQQWGVESGQLWQLGDHRLICGDCTDAAVVARVMGGEKAQLMVTDPPYGIEHDTSWREQAGISNMGAQSAKGIEWDSNDNWSVAYRLSNAEVAFVWHASSHNIVVAQTLVDAGYDVKQMIVWNKTVAPFGRSHYSYKHEPCWYAVKKGKTANWHGPNDEVTVWDTASPRHIMGGSDEEKTPHPTQKPIMLYERPITNHTQSGEILYDPFCGSGTAIIACENLGRKCRAVEISPAYVAVALQRWADHTGREPVLLD